MISSVQSFSKILISSHNQLRPYYLLILIAILITHIFQLTIPLHAGDDWTAARIYGGYQYKDVIATGRWMHLVSWLILGGDQLANSFTFSLILIAIFISSLYCIKILNYKNIHASLIFIFLIITSPLLVETYQFNHNHGTIFFSIIFATLAFHFLNEHIHRPRISSIVLASIFVSFTIASYQAYLNLILIMVISKVLVNRLSNQEIHALKYAKALATVLCLGIFLYIAEANILRLITGIESSDVNKSYRLSEVIIKSVDDFKLVVMRFIEIIYIFFFKEQAGIPYLVKILLLPFYGYLLFQCIKSEQKLMSSFLFVLLFTIPWSVSLLLTTNSGLRYNALYSLAFLMAVIISSSIHICQNKVLQKTFVALGYLIVCTFIFQTNVVNYTTFMSNKRDMNFASDVLSRIQSSTEYSPSAKKINIFIIGEPTNTNRNYPFKPSTYENKQNIKYLNSSIVSCGIPYCQQGRLSNALNMLSIYKNNFYSRKISNHSSKYQYLIENNILSEMETWPHPKSIYMDSPDKIYLMMGTEQ